MTSNADPCSVVAAAVFSLLLACGSSGMTPPKGSAGSSGGAGAAGASGAGGSGQPGGGGRMNEGATGGHDAGGTVMADAMTSVGICTDGLPQMGHLIIPKCGGNPLPTGGPAFPDGTYQLVDIEVIGAACAGRNTPPPMNRALKVNGSNLEGIDGVLSSNNVYWSHWRATAAFDGNRVSYMFECGQSNLGTEYTVANDEIVLFSGKNDTRHAFHFKRL